MVLSLLCKHSANDSPSTLSCHPPRCDMDGRGECTVWGAFGYGTGVSFSVGIANSCQSEVWADRTS